SRLIDTPEGIVLAKCDGRIPANTSVKLEDVRAELEKEVLQKKVQLEIRTAFTELSKKANPRQFLKDSSKPEDLAADIMKELSEKPDAGKAGKIPGTN